MYAMMQCKTKSENLAHIFGYQIWAVTNLPPLQESRPEIPRVGRGKRENITTLNFHDLLYPTGIFLVADKREQTLPKFPNQMQLLKLAKQNILEYPYLFRKFQIYML